MKNKKIPSKMDMTIVVPTIVITFIVVALLVWGGDGAKTVISKIYEYLVEKLGWIYIVACVLSFVFLAWVTFSKYGNIKLGGEDEKPAYTNFAWGAMIFCSGVGSSAVILGFLEPLYYVQEPPFHLEPFSEQAYEYAHLYGQFHWGPSAWAFYIPAIVAMSLIVYKEKCDDLRLSSVCTYSGGSLKRKYMGKAIDVLVMFGILASISTSFGLAVPVISLLVSNLFGIPNNMLLKIAIIVVWICIFTTSVYLGLDKGIKKLSDINVIILLAFLALFFVLGNPSQILKAEVTSVGLYFQNFIRMNTWADPFGDGNFLNMWAIFYWGWWMAFMPMMALFVVRISKGRTLKNVIWQQLIWGSLGCWACFSVFGGYSLNLQKSGVDLVSILNNEGQEGVITYILEHIPAYGLVTAIFLLLIFIFLATTIDSAAFILSSNSVKKSAQLQPTRNIRFFWAIVLAVLSVGLLAIGELKAVQTISLIAGLPMVFVQFYICKIGKNLVIKHGKNDSNQIQ